MATKPPTRSKNQITGIPQLPQKAPEVAPSAMVPCRAPPLVQGERSLKGLEDAFIATENGSHLGLGWQLPAVESWSFPDVMGRHGATPIARWMVVWFIRKIPWFDSWMMG